VNTYLIRQLQKTLIGLENSGTQVQFWTVSRSAVKRAENLCKSAYERRKPVAREEFSTDSEMEEDEMDLD
jgi:hypothetical protein